MAAALVARTLVLGAARPARRLLVAGTVRMAARPPAGLARAVAAARPATMPTTAARGFCSAAAAAPEAPASLQPGERHIYEKLRAALTPTQLYVEDISGTRSGPRDVVATARATGP